MFVARPIKEGLDYFPHDTDAVNDEKIEALMMLYGAKGYAFYFILLERIYRSPDFELNISDAETGQETKQILAKKIAITMEEFEMILCTSLKWGCFCKQSYEERGVLTSKGIKKRAGVVVEKREKMRAKYHFNKEIISDAETTQETGEETPQSKEKKSKVKESKIKYLDYVSMTEIEYQKLINEYGEAVVLDKMDDLNNWKGGKGKRTKSDYLTLRNWIKKDQQKGVKPIERTGGFKQPDWL